MKINGIEFDFEIKNGFPLAKVRSGSENYYLIAMFLTVWNNSRYIKSDLIPYVNERIKKGLEKFIDDEGIENLLSFEADPIGDALIDKDKTIISSWASDKSKCEVPTLIFKNIILEWLDFLEKNGK
ncbi:hypothetical protein LVD17_08940 [Fulvivirga ulvae]|uniref:hypothetical protein n=1 Tax=Fulvivirga ulvae TaxID=2904245 RepID=UPI001F26EA2F|nr:hypothetical protein [Fulvivirga ulvae]UII33939.1 hypothetical protein LVD17_08940 [Fulvivirga ulvae]